MGMCLQNYARSRIASAKTHLTVNLRRRESMSDARPSVSRVTASVLRRKKKHKTIFFAETTSQCFQLACNPHACRRVKVDDDVLTDMTSTPTYGRSPK